MASEENEEKRMRMKAKRTKDEMQGDQCKELHVYEQSNSTKNCSKEKYAQQGETNGQRYLK